MSYYEGERFYYDQMRSDDERWQTQVWEDEQGRTLGELRLDELQTAEWQVREGQAYNQLAERLAYEDRERAYQDQARYDGAVSGGVAERSPQPAAARPVPSLPRAARPAVAESHNSYNSYSGRRSLKSWLLPAAIAGIIGVMGITELRSGDADESGLPESGLTETDAPIPETLTTLPATRTLEDGTVLPSILGGDIHDTGSDAVTALNHWLATGNPQAVEEFGLRAENALSNIRDFHDIRHLAPGQGEDTPIWQVQAGEMNHGQDLDPTPMYVISLEDGSYLAEIGDGQAASGSEPQPFDIRVSIMRNGDSCEVSSIDAAPRE